VVEAFRSLVNSVPGHFGPLKNRSDQGPKWMYLQTTDWPNALDKISSRIIVNSY